MNLHVARASAATAEPSLCRLAVEDVSFAYPGAEPVNRNIGFRILDAEILCLLGPNGAGKTTLIRQIVGDVVPDSGSVRVCGLDVAAARGAALAHMGVIPQQTNLFDGLTVDQHLLYFGHIKGLRGGALEERSAKVRAMLDLDAIRGKRAGRLSGGQRRIVLLALAMLADPALLILDEPTTGLDPIARERVWSAIRREKEGGKSILLTTHYLEEAQALADRVGFVVSGKLVRLGTIAQLCAELGKKVRVAVPGRETLYFASLEEAQAFIGSARPPEYSVSATSLADIYSTVVAP